MFSGFIYELPYFLISYIVLMGISLGGSVLIEALKEVFGYNERGNNGMRTIISNFIKIQTNVWKGRSCQYYFFR